jgi:hypothetical protein
MSCDPLVIEHGCRPVTVKVTDDTTIITVTHKRGPMSVPLLVWTFGPVQEQPSGPLPGVSMQTMSATQQTTGTVQPVDHLGHPAPVQAGSSVFTSSDVNVLTVSADPTNELSVLVKGVLSGTAQVRWSADADLGDGVVTISAAEDFTITSAMATGASFGFTPPVEQA